MTLLLDDGAAEPGTHVLLVGAGNYPFLKDGSSPKRFELHMEMGQLTSPPHSLLEVLNWFCDKASGFNNEARPLRSMQALCSASPAVSWAGGGGAPVPLAPARFADVSQAVKDWKARAHRNPENLAVFYFCGHGLAFGEAQNALLLEGFGSDTDNPMADAIAFDEMRLGLMALCDARYQVHLIDACRSVPTRKYVEKYGDESTGQPILAGGISNRLREKTAPAYFATGLASVAYGQIGRPSLFTQGLMQALRGSGSRDADDAWDVTIGALAGGINRSVESLDLPARQYCQPREAGHEFALHRVRGEPEVIVKVFMRDEARLPQVVLAHTREGQAGRVTRAPVAQPWWLRLASARYTFEALEGAAAGAVLAQRVKHVAPPGADVGL